MVMLGNQKPRHHEVAASQVAGSILILIVVVLVRKTSSLPDSQALESSFLKPRYSS
jgi:hypothetical protein